MDDILNDIINNKYNSENWVLKKYPDFHFFIDNLYIIFDISWKEKFYLYINKMDSVPLCYCGNKLKFIKGKYRKYCSKKCMANDPIIINKKKQTCLEKWGVDVPTKSDYIKDKIKKETYTKWNVDNISKLEFVKNKVKETNNKKYGVDYVSQLESIKKKLSSFMSDNSNKLIEKKREQIRLNIIKKVANYNIKLLNIIESSIYEMQCDKEHIFTIHKNMLNDRIRNKNTICTICNKINSASDSQNKLFDFIAENYNGIILKNDRSLIGQELDIYIPDIKLAFEYNGLYWHSELYKEKNYHYNKTQKCLDNKIKLIHIWEDDWLNKNDIVKSRILNLLGKSKKIYARKCEVRKISSSEAKNFLELNHIQGTVPSKVSIGLYYNKQIVSVMTFGSLRKSLGQNFVYGHYEMLRYCTILNTTIIGGASKLFSYFLKNYDVLQVISYADRSWSDGNLYKRLGFSMEHITKPNYYYIVNSVRKNRYCYRKDKLVSMGYDKNKSESKIMEEIGFYKIYDSGSLKFKYINE